MDEILSVKTLPETLHRRFRSDRVRVHEENGVVTLTPVKDVNEQARASGSKLRFDFVNAPPLPDSFFDPLPEEELQAWGL